MYYLYDFYEGTEKIGAFETIEEATAAARERDEETDGECDLALLRRPIAFNDDGSLDIDMVEEWRY